MKRRTFLSDSLKYSSLFLTLPAFLSLGAACSDGPKASKTLNDDDDPGFPDPEEWALVDMQIFGYYQAYTANETLSDRDLSRTDGTKSGILTSAQVEVNEPLTLDFWHGHGAKHTFTLTSEHFDLLRQGETVYVLTSLVADHMHCARIVPVFA